MSLTVSSLSSGILNGGEKTSSPVVAKENKAIVKTDHSKRRKKQQRRLELNFGGGGCGGGGGGGCGGCGSGTAPAFIHRIS